MTELLTGEPLASDWLDHANALCTDGRYVEALAIASPAVQATDTGLRVKALNLSALCALGLHRIHDAETLWRAAIAIEPAFVDVYDNLGALLVSLDRFAEAERVYREWLSFAPANADALHALAGTLRAQHRWAEAAACSQDALAIRPDDAALRFDLALALHEQRELASAEQAYRAVLASRPDHPGVPYRLGNVLKDLGRFPEAIGAYQQALAIDSRDADALHQLGDTLRNTGHLSEAEKACALALAIRPGDAATLNTLAAVLCALQRLPEAEAVCRRALDARPAFAEAHFNLGIILNAMGRREEAVDAYESARRERDDVVEIHNNLGCVLRDLDRLEDAAQVFRDALAVRPSFAQAAYNLGNVLKALGQFDAAEAAYRQAIGLRADYAEARFGLATLLLSLGRFDAAWPLYESRYDHPEFVHHATRALLRCAQWQGESLDGKTLLVWQEDGLGDMLHFGRYFSLLKARGASRVVFACMPALQRLFSTVPGVDGVLDHQAALSQAESFDCWTSPLSAPYHLGTTFDARAPAGYLHADASLVERWRTRIDADVAANVAASVSVTMPVPTPMPASVPMLGQSTSPLCTRKIGVAWKGNPRHHNDAHRSLPSLATLAPLWAIPGLAFVSLQKGAGESELASFEHPIAAFGSDITDLADTAAIIAQLDLVICVDTSVAHLAASLGKACWIVLPERDVDWRWMHERDDSPWYPDTVRLFRRAAGEPWDAVIERVRSALAVSM